MAVIKLIWCQDPEGGIGKNNLLPWKIATEMQHFKNVTNNQIVVMGRKTFESIGQPLPNRTNIVLSRNTKFIHPGVKVFSSIDLLLRKYKNRQIIVIGGKQIYETFFARADELIVSTLHKKYDCDTYLNFNYQNFELVNTENFEEFRVNYYKNIQNRAILNVSIDQFDGPLDLLLTLIKEKRYDLNNLDIAKLTDQYLTYVRKELAFISLDTAGDYLSTASDLIDLKSRLLIAQEAGLDSEDMIDYMKYREEFLMQLFEYKKIRKCLTWLHKKQRIRLDKFLKPADSFEVLWQSIERGENLTLPKSMSIDKIKEGFENAIARLQINTLKKQQVEIHETSVEEVNLDFKKWMDNHNYDRASFEQYRLSLDSLKSSLKYVVIVFLLILTLVRSGELTIELVDEQIWFNKTPAWIPYEQINHPEKTEKNY